MTKIPDAMVEAAAKAIGMRSRGVAVPDEFREHANDALTAAGLPELLDFVAVLREWRIADRLATGVRPTEEDIGRLQAAHDCARLALHALDTKLGSLT